MAYYDTVLFDLDGTLTDSAPGITKCAALALDHYGIPYESLDALRIFIGPPLRLTFPQMGVPEEEVENAVAIFRSRYNTVGKFENKPYEGIVELLAKLKESGVHLFVATSKPEGTAREILDKFDLAKYFEEIAGATPDASRDTKEKVIAYLMSIAPVGGRCLMVGDTVFDVEGANHTGMDSAGVSWGFGDEQAMLREGAKVVVHNMDELFLLIEDGPNTN